MKKDSKIPPCVIEEVNFCRSCPGWSFMLNAAKEKKGLWGKLPIHCSITGLTIYPEEIKSKN